MKISPPIASTLYVQGDSSHSYSSSPSDETEDYKQLDSPLQELYNLTKIPRYTLELVRGDIFSNLGASLAHAFIAVSEIVICLTLYFLSTQMNYETIL